MKQKTLFKLKNYSSEFGGSLLQKGQRKRSRPLSSQNSLHIVLRGDTSRSGSLLKNRSLIDHTLFSLARKFNVLVYRHSIVSNHIHLVAQFPCRENYVKWIRAFTGSLALKTKIKWLFRPWSRILKWGRGFEVALQYVLKNHFEAEKLLPYQKRMRGKKIKRV